MRCPTCDSWTEVLDTRPGEHGTTGRRRECANGHRFHSVEIARATYTLAGPAIRRSLATLAARRGRWKRDSGIAVDPRPAKIVAAEVGLHFAEVNKIRATFRKLRGTPAP